jgi:hypothetical protein
VGKTRSGWKGSCNSPQEGCKGSKEACSGWESFVAGRRGARRSARENSRSVVVCRGWRGSQRVRDGLVTK